MDRMGINYDTRRSGLRQCLKTNTSSDIKKPSFETYMATMKSEVHLAKFKSYPTSKIKKCLRCDDKANNTEHVIYHCPLARFI